jgi:hypothetical protein
MKKLAFVVIGVVAVIGLLTAFDGDGRNFRDGEHHRMKDGNRQERVYDGFDKMCEELELTDKQIEQLEDLKINGKKDMIVASADLKLLEIDKKTAMKEKDFKQAKAVTEEIFKIKEQMAINKIEHQEKKWNILTLEQQEKAEELRGERRPAKHKKMKRKK